MRREPLLALLAACGTRVGLVDRDGDGWSVLDGDCWDSVEPEQEGGPSGTEIHPGATETWYDGVDQDCDGNDDYDQDADGQAATAGDCDDTDPGVYPGAEETWYDGIDQDCGGGSDYDQDGDGDEALGWGGDCDDTDPNVASTAEETWYDGTDQDCDGNDDDQDGDGYAVDEDCDDTDPARFPNPDAEEIWYNAYDEDCDGNDGDQDGDGWVPDSYASTTDWAAFPAHVGAGDCWDDPEDRPAAFIPLNGFDELLAEEVHPGAEDRPYDSVDQDCAGDDDFDADGDGFRSDTWPDETYELGDDCADDDPAIHPGAAETWYDGVDQDCAGDDDWDQDADGYTAPGAPSGSGDDCDDTDSATSPAGAETCDAEGRDEDCDGNTNEADAPGCSDWYLDGDADGYGATETACLCEAEAPFSAVLADDCDDTDGTIHPDAIERWADEVDQDCDGAEICYSDRDGDGYSTDTGLASLDVDCDDGGEASAALSTGDCDDDDPAVHPGADEVCDDADTDEDCDGLADDADDSLDPASRSTAYPDADGDGYGDAEAGLTACDLPGDTVDDGTDCDDADGSVYPGAAETVADGTDSDCDGEEVCWSDRDADGYGRPSRTVSSTDLDCTDSLESTLDTDCDDTDATVYPGAPDLWYDGVDADCDGASDYDQDADGYDAPIGGGADCDDADATIFPEALEQCDAVDDDCDGEVLDVDEDADGSNDFSTYYMSIVDGDTGGVRVQSESAFDFEDGAFTLEMWVRADSFDAGGGEVLLLDRASDAHSAEPWWVLALVDDGGTGIPQLRLTGEAGGDLADGTTTAPASLEAATWTHLAVAVDIEAGWASWYLDGELAGTEALPDAFVGSSLASRADLYVSPREDGLVNGGIDELRIWGVVRTEAEIQDSLCAGIDSGDAAWEDLRLYLPLEGSEADAGPASLDVNGSPTFEAL